LFRSLVQSQRSSLIPCNKVSMYMYFVSVVLGVKGQL